MRRRALVKTRAGISQLPARDSIAGTQTLRAYLSDGTLIRIPLDDNGEVPIELSGGASSSAPISGATHG